MKPEPKAKAKAAADLPLPAVIEELAYLRKSFRELIAAYTTGIESEIAHLHTLLSADAAGKRKLPANRLNDLRDMLMTLRSLDVKPTKGRRRDLKRVENVVEDLRTIAERWS
ncbi:MAG: hypothetical protein K8R23_10275 [Chthoniobacter sp.]|nr:hypothetical protein [Chthoniobacter sp.]